MECDKENASSASLPVNQDESAVPVNEAKWRVNMEDSPSNWELQWDYLQSILWRFMKGLKKMGKIFKIQDT